MFPIYFFIQIKIHICNRKIITKPYSLGQILNAQQYNYILMLQIKLLEQKHSLSVRSSTSEEIQFRIQIFNGVLRNGGFVFGRLFAQSLLKQTLLFTFSELLGQVVEARILQVDHQAVVGEKHSILRLR